MSGTPLNDNRSRALLASALHGSSSPNERLMALAALERVLARAGLHPSDLALYDASARSPAEAVQQKAADRRDTENAALAARVRAQEVALRKAGREAEVQAREMTALRAEIARLETIMADDGCQIAALEADLATRDRLIATLREDKRNG